MKREYNKIIEQAEKIQKDNGHNCGSTTFLSDIGDAYQIMIIERLDKLIKLNTNKREEQN